ncbi:MAG: hypothetical protein Q4D06_02980 [Coriobacteriia bacterium]|nr:hypothetical protein [Coriobacteriia bacterium]
MQDWRIRGNTQDWLRGLELLHESWSGSPTLTYEPGSPDPTEAISDHDHCAFCWAKLSEGSAGYLAQNGPRHEWICEDCFKDLAVDFEWTAKESLP